MITEEEIVIEAPEVKPQNRLQRIIESMLHVFGIDDFISYAVFCLKKKFVVAVVFVGVLEIFNTHLAVRLNRNITKKQDAIKELLWEYMTVKTDLNQKSKQSELQKILDPYGLKSLQAAPKKIEVKK